MSSWSDCGREELCTLFTEVSLKDNNLHFKPKKQWMTAPDDILTLQEESVRAQNDLSSNIFTVTFIYFLTYITLIFYLQVVLPYTHPTSNVYICICTVYMKKSLAEL